MMKIMKKNYIKFMAVVALVLVSGCSQENEIGGGDSIEFGKNTIVFTMGKPSTRSAVALSDVAKQGEIIPLGTDETGTSFYLEESVIDLNAPITRGTPAYTENVGALYTSFAAKSELSPTDDVDLFTNTEGTYKWTNTFKKNIWENNNTLHFWMYMPTDMTSNGVSNLAYPEEQITFDYESPATAEEQQDILFSYQELEKGTYEATALFHHALTGVKFRLGNTESNISISSITFNDLITEGSCTVTPRQESTGYVDDITEFSSGDGSTVVWNLVSSGQEVRGDVSSGTFDGTVNFNTGGSFGENLPYPESFAKNNNDKNLNKSDGSQTFWLIPQTISGVVKLTIAYTDAYGDHTWTVDFGTVLNGVEWKAGQIRTYTIRIDDVNVKIEDTVTIGSDQTTTYTDDKGNTHTIYGGTKEGIAITNTGNTDAFIRVAITGQWVDENGAPVFSFTDFTQSDIIQEIASWYNDQFGDGDGDFGVFEGLVGYTKNGKTGSGNAGWVKGNDGYYYYTTKVAPNATTGTAPFTSYTVDLDNVPRIKVAGALQDVHFVMEVSTQAISAKKLDGSDYAWNEAWENALGEDPSASK